MQREADMRSSSH